SRKVEVRQYTIRLRDGPAKLVQKFSSIHSAARVELTVPLTNIRHSTESADNPLSDIALEMEDQIADAVRFGVGLPPDVLERQSFDCLLDPWQVAVGQQLSGLLDENSRNLSHEPPLR